MFNTLTKTCCGENAACEILTMLTGAFILGFLLGWLIKELRSLDNSPEKRELTSIFRIALFPFILLGAVVLVTLLAFYLIWITLAYHIKNTGKQ